MLEIRGEKKKNGNSFLENHVLKVITYYIYLHNYINPTKAWLILFINSKFPFINSSHQTKTNLYKF